MIRRVKQSLFWIIMATITLAILFDYFTVIKKVEPMFCFTEHTKKYDDGEVKTWIGLGYKIIKYDRESYTKGIVYTHILSKGV